MTTTNTRIGLMLDQETSNTRFDVTLDREISSLLLNTAKTQNLSMSLTVNMLLREAFELREDFLLSKHGDNDLDNAKKRISHEEFWKE